MGKAQEGITATECDSCGGTRWYSKHDVVFDVKFGGGRLVRAASSSQRWLRCTLLICAGCGRMLTYVQDPNEWLGAVGVDEIIDVNPEASR